MCEREKTSDCLLLSFCQMGEFCVASAKSAGASTVIITGTDRQLQQMKFLQLRHLKCRWAGIFAVWGSRTDPFQRTPSTVQYMLIFIGKD